MAPPHYVALAFETGGDATPARAMLDTLASAGVVATFFIDGSWAERHPPLIERIASAGHEFGTHGFAHQDWTALDDDAVTADLRATEEIVSRLVGQSVKPWARPPYGALDERVAAVLARDGYLPIYRDAVDGAHWPGETTTHSIEERAYEAARGDGVVTFHTNSPFTAEALPSFLARLEKAELVRLDELDPPPSHRVDLHTDFAELRIAPGYVRPKQRGMRWQSLNLLELGAASTRLAASSSRVIDLDQLACELVTGSGAERMPGAVDTHDRYILVLAGELRCDFGDDGASGDLLARTGDMFLCPAGVAYRLGPTATGRRYVAAVWLISDRNSVAG